jgi:hypothetical protein
MSASIWSRPALQKTDLGRTLLSEMRYETPARAPGWIFKGVSISCVPDAVYPWDPDVVRALREVDDAIVPVFVKYVFDPPYDQAERQTVVLGRHGLALYRHHLRYVAEPFPLEMPSFVGLGFRGLRFERPNRYLVTLMEEINQPGTELPGAYVPLNWSAVSWVQDGKIRARRIDQALRESREQNRAAEAKRKADREDEHNRKQDSIQRYIDSLEVSDVEWEQYQRAQAAGEIQSPKKESVVVGPGTTPAA